MKEVVAAEERYEILSLGHQVSSQRSGFLHSTRFYEFLVPQPQKEKSEKSKVGPYAVGATKRGCRKMSVPLCRHTVWGTRNIFKGVQTFDK